MVINIRNKMLTFGRNENYIAHLMMFIMRNRKKRIFTNNLFKTIDGNHA